MIERSHEQKTWYELNGIEKTSLGWIIHILVRWNERQESRQADVGTVTEYVYDAYWLDYQLPVEVQPGREAVEYYLGQAQTAIVQLAQEALAQEAGFHDAN